MNRISQRNRKPSQTSSDYIVIDIETTGLHSSDEIIEIGAIHIADGTVQESFSTLIQCSAKIPDEIQKLTGINLRFDMQFLQKACTQHGFPIMKNKMSDTMKLARKKLDLNAGYGLSSVADYLGLHQEKRHRALDDCMLTYRIFEKLKEI